MIISKVEDMLIENQSESRLYALVQSIHQQTQYKLKQEGLAQPITNALLLLSRQLYDIIVYASAQDQALLMNELEEYDDFILGMAHIDKPDLQQLLLYKACRVLKEIKHEEKSADILTKIHHIVLDEQQLKLSIQPLQAEQISLAKIVIHSLIFPKKIQKNQSTFIPPPIPNFKIIDLIGFGGFSHVYIAHYQDQDQSYECALKIGQLEHEARFLREIKNMKLVHHPNVINLIDAGIVKEGDQSYYWIAMPQMRNVNLKHLIDQKEISIENKWLILSQILAGLCALHQQGIIHRDLKPANCLISDDFQIKLSDFGLSKNISLFNKDFSMEESKYQQAIGTPAYMSPEQAQGLSCALSSDIWSFGIIAYELFFGDIPFGNSDNMFVLVANLLKENIDFSHPTEMISMQATQFIQKCLHKNPLERIQSAIELKPIFQTLISQELKQIKINQCLEDAHQLLSQKSIDAIHSMLLHQPQDQYPQSLINITQNLKQLKQINIPLFHQFIQFNQPSKHTIKTIISQEISKEITDFDQQFESWQIHQKLPYFRDIVFPRKKADLFVYLSMLMIFLSMILYTLYHQPQKIKNSNLKTQVDQSIQWIKLNAGVFSMGSLEGPSDERPIHQVKIKAFEISRSEITVDQYQKCMEAGVCTKADDKSIDPACNLGWDDRLLHPINCVDWYQARQFAQWLGGDLPSESQWEYAAKSEGKNNKYPWGEEKPSCLRAVMFENQDGCGQNHSWAVCSKTAGNTEQGLCDMAGNVWEWVLDEWHGSYEDAPIDQRAWCSDQECMINQRSSRVRKGGGWYNYGSAIDLRISDRSGYAPSFRYYYLGFRVVKNLD